MSNKEAISKSPSGRVQRTPVGKRSILSVRGKDPEYHYRIVNDKDDRIEAFLAAGYEAVNAKDIKVGDNRVDAASPEGSVARVSVGLGDKAVVMRIRKDWFEEDQARKLKEVDLNEAATKQEALNGTYGKLDISRS